MKKQLFKNKHRPVAKRPMASDSFSRQLGEALGFMAAIASVAHDVFDFESANNRHDQPIITEDADFEIVAPKQLTNSHE